MSRKAHSTSRGSMLSRKRAVTIGTNPCADGGTPKPSRFPIRVLPTAPGNALWVSAAPSNVAYWGQSGKHVLDLRFTAFDPQRTSRTIDVPIYGVGANPTKAIFAVGMPEVRLDLCDVLILCHRLLCKISKQ